MNDNHRLQLEKMIRENDVEDYTGEIRKKKHSKKIRDDVTTMINMKKQYKRLETSNPNQFNRMVSSKCNFLFNNYTDIYNRVKKEEINLSTLWDLLNVLEKIENEELDQHTGSYQVGNLLKKIYIDSAIVKSERLDKKHASGKRPNKPSDSVKTISWKQYKANVLQ